MAERVPQALSVALHLDERWTRRQVESTVVMAQPEGRTPPCRLTRAMPPGNRRCGRRPALAAVIVGGWGCWLAEEQVHAPGQPRGARHVRGAARSAPSCQVARAGSAGSRGTGSHDQTWAPVRALYPRTTPEGGSLLLRCRALSSPSPCRFIPAHPQFPPSPSERSEPSTPGSSSRLHTRIYTSSMAFTLRNRARLSLRPTEAGTLNDAAGFAWTLRTAQSLPQKGFRHWASTRPVSRPSRQSAIGPPGSYPNRTHTGWRRRASDQFTATR